MILTMTPVGRSQARPPRRRPAAQSAAECPQVRGRVEPGRFLNLLRPVATQLALDPFLDQDLPGSLHDPFELHPPGPVLAVRGQLCAVDMGEQTDGVQFEYHPPPFLAGFGVELPGTARHAPSRARLMRVEGALAWVSVKDLQLSWGRLAASHRCSISSFRCMGSNSSPCLSLRSGGYPASKPRLPERSTAVLKELRVSVRRLPPAAPPGR
jgi:hypothetical protein